MKAERRQLTILNCDILGSSVYADSLDPEDFASLLSIFFSTCNKVVGTCGGTLAQNSGDGILAYFGYPKTHGQDARDAIECGKLIVEALARESMSGADEFQVRIGITTGLVVLTDVQVQHGKSDRIAIGSAAHRSERIQKLADGGEVLVDDASRKLSERYYEFVDLGMHKLKGFTRPSQVWGVGDPRPVMFRFEERGPSLAPIVGRDSELELLSVLWSQAREGKGWAAYISGEPGIGKSRLVFEFARQSAPHVAPLVLQCIRDHENAPLHPWLSYISQVAEVGPVDSMAERRQKVDAVLGAAYPEHDWLPSFVLQLLTQGGSKQDQEDDEMLPPRRLGALQDAIVKGLLGWCSRSPQILIVEDVHWIDPTSKTLLEMLLASISVARILVLVTSRHEASPSVSGSHTARLELGKLTASQSRELITTILGSTTDEEAVVEWLVSRSDGIPLYVEEMARAMSEGELDLLGHQDSGEPADDGVAINVTIPDALQGTLYTRLDALGDRKWVAQVASVIGRVFDLRVLASLSGRSAASLGGDISALLDSGLVESVRSGATHIFEFKHALVRDAAYSSLLHRDAQKLHGELAHLYEREYPEMQRTQPEVVVRHLSQAGRWLDAANVWLKAGEFATEVGSTTEAMTRLDHCLECLNQVPSSTEVDEVRMRGQLALGSVINIHFGPADPKAQQALDVAAELAEALEDTEALIECLTSLGTVTYNAGDFSGAGSVATRMVEIGEQYGSLGASVKGLTVSGLCSFAMGQFRKAREELERARKLVARAEPETQRFERFVLVYLALTMHILGEPGVASELCDTALERARTQRTTDLLSTLGNSLYLYWMQGNIELTRETARELSKMAEKTGHLMWYHQAAFFLGWVRAIERDETGLAMMEASMIRFRDAGELVEQSMFYGIMAEQYLVYERHILAIQTVDHGLELVERLSERFFEVPLLQLKAKCLLAQSAGRDYADQIADILDRASRLADEQGAVAWTQADRA